MMKTIEFLFDFGSPTAYLAWTQIPAIAERHGTAIDYQPVLLGAIHQASKNKSPVTIAAKAKWMTEDMARFAQRYGVPLEPNPYFPINTLQLMRGATALKGTERFMDYCAAVFDAMWVEPQDLGDPRVLATTLRTAGFDPEELVALSSRQEVKDALRATTESAVSRGAFGAPTFFVNGEMHFGQDRLDFVEQAVAGAESREA
ncbi:MAG: 2-hydroxychromene-2-carboxylate isomerase [Myxococcota bacterium]